MTNEPKYRAEKIGRQWYAMRGNEQASQGFKTKREAETETTKRMISDLAYEAREFDRINHGPFEHPVSEPACMVCGHPEETDEHAGISHLPFSKAHNFESLDDIQERAAFHMKVHKLSE